MNQYLVRTGQKVDLDDFDPDDTSLVPGGKPEAKERLAAIVERLARIQELLFAGHKRKLLIVLQGMDTSGKDGTIRHVMRGFNPQGTRVVSFRKPSEEELDHDFLWRVHAKVPAKGETVVFNRSHYEDVLIVRVHELVPKAVWARRYDEINAFERMLSGDGTVVLKFFLHISREEQRRRLQARVDNPKKCWKFQHGDLEERKFWNDYVRAYEDALSKTSTEWAPWYIVPANQKWYRNHLVGSIVAETLDKLHLKYPKCDLSHVVVK
ncbi:MAG: polyphosphate kinase 2 family protein [Gemmatimonadales bacterium]|nr:polyphosphate kinase 2 family protein [Gemmatimonadales bacterium]